MQKIVRILLQDFREYLENTLTNIYRNTILLIVDTIKGCKSYTDCFSIAQDGIIR